MTQAIDHRTARSKAKSRTHRKPKQDPKHMLMGRQDRVLNGQAGDFLFVQLTGIDALPLGEFFSGKHLIPGLQGVLDVCEMVTELSKAQGGIQNQHTPQTRQDPPKKGPQQPVKAQGRNGGQSHAQAPDQTRVFFMACIQLFADELGPSSLGAQDPIVLL